MTEILSPNVARAVEIAVGAGNSIADVTGGWSKARQVVTMAAGLTPEVREQIERAAPTLRYWSDPGAPQFPPTEGYIDDTAAVGLSFPARPRLRW